MDRAPAPQTGLPERAARTLLRKLRDLDLRAAGLRVDAGRTVRLGGCLAPDAPIEEGLTYRLELSDGRQARLDLAWRDGALELALDGAGPAAPLRIELLQDEAGRATAPAIRARMHPDANDRREVEHFLRRLVRAAFGERRVA